MMSALLECACAKSHPPHVNLSEPTGRKKKKKDLHALGERERGRLDSEGEREREMQNESGEVVDTYIPRKCSASGRIIGAKDHASVQI